MTVFPNSKINLGLRILRKRSDGYHDLETIFYPIPLTDVLEINKYAVYQEKFTIPFSKSGFVIDADSSDNLCVKAFRLLRKDFPKMTNVQMHLHKAVPAGAGLGGGSADAAFTLLLLNDLFDLGLSQQQLLHYALKLGSDCPFFILNKPCYATSRGEVLEPIELDLSAYQIVVVNPGIHINTGRAFLDIKPTLQEISIKEITSWPIERWKDELVNDFEQSAFIHHPEIVEIKDKLYIGGAIYASMTGSGSTVYGIFKKGQPLSFPFPENYFVRELSLS
jgi:4-diphosphocytidyl-2-C-methyl-D-erythritol kinase